MGSTIGKLTPVNLREIWPKEEKDFSKWLSDNLEYVSEAVDINLEPLDTEKSLDKSRFTVDILAIDDNEDKVIIENQLEKTDHTHLGQIITYATNMDVKTVIWISKSPRTEHINAINWLNEVSDKDFYLLQLDAYQIDSSNPAPFFSVICKPSEEAKIIGADKKELDHKRELRRARRSASDTIIVPAREEGYKKVFIGENAWYSIRIKKEQIAQIKYIAGYQTAPISAITHTAKVKEIVPSHEDESKYKVIFDGPAKKIKPIPLGEKSKIQGPSYCIYSKLETAKTVDDLLDFDQEDLKAA